MDSLLARSAILMAVAGGIASAQTDSVPAPVADSAKVVAPATVVSAPVADTVVKPVVDTTVPVAPVAPAPSVVDSAKVVVPVAPAPVVDSPALPASTDPVKQERHFALVVDAGIHYGFTLGELLDEEGRLMRHFNVFLENKGDKTSQYAVDPISTGISYRIGGWARSNCGNQFGMRLQYGRLSEHPASSFSASLTEDFMEQFLVTARYRRSFSINASIEAFGDAALGWNHVNLSRLPIVAAHLDDGTLDNSKEIRDPVRAIHAETDLDGIHGEVAVGVEYKIAPRWSLGMSAEYGIGQLWLGSRTSTDVELGYPESIGYMGFGFGLFVSHGF